MKAPNPNSPRTNISLDQTVKVKAIALAKKRWGKNGTLSMLITELILRADEIYGKDTPPPSKPNKSK